jgi:acetone carboxylase gamma subunit
MSKPIPVYDCPARQFTSTLSRAAAAAFLRHQRRKRVVIRCRDGHTYCAPATQWNNWRITTRPTQRDLDRASSWR